MKRILMLAFSLALLQPSCVVAGGYRSGDGWFFWPGGLLGVLIIVAVLFLLARRRK
jgi:uncharacterized membrane protein YdcZ (DUF606 family)